MTFNTSPGLVVTFPPTSNGGAPTLAAGYLTGLQMWKTGDATLVVAAGEARDSTDSRNIVLAADSAVDFSAVGIDGADAAIPNADAILYVYVVGGFGQPDGVLVSVSAVAPVLPAGYTVHRFVGSIPVSTGEGPFQLDWMQQGNGRTREVRLGPQEQQQALVGGPWTTAMGSLPDVDASLSWRNIVAGGTDVQFDPATRVPARPAGAGGNDARRGIRVTLLLFTRVGNSDFIEFAPAHGAVEVPTTSPGTGDSNMRAYNTQSAVQSAEYRAQVGDGQMLQYRSTNVGNEYLIAIAGWHDEL